MNILIVLTLQYKQYTLNFKKKEKHTSNRFDYEKQ